MQKLLLSLLLIGGAHLSGWAQTAPAPAPTPAAGATPAPWYGRRDTVHALTSMYERHRRGGKTWLCIAAAGTGVFVRAATATPTSTNPYVTTSEPNPAGLAVVFGLFAGLPAAIGINKLVSFSEAKQAEAIQLFRSSNQLPKNILRHLKEKDF